MLDRYNTKKNNNRIAGKDIEQQELWFLVGGNVKWYSQFERQFGSFLQS